MKKGVIAGIIFGVLFVSMIGFASAATMGERLTSLIDEVTKVIEPIAKNLLGETAAGAGFTAGELLFAKVLFLLIVMSVIYLALSQVDFFNYSRWTLWIITLGAAILSVRFLGNTIVPAILIPYSALGIFLAAGIPFVIAFFVIERAMSGPANKTIRRVAWIFFAVIFLGLWIARGSESDAALIYPATAIISLIMMSMDGTIQNFFNSMTFDKASSMQRGPALQALNNLIAGVHTGFSTLGTSYVQAFPPNPAVIGITAYKNDIRELEQRRKQLLRT